MARTVSLKRLAVVAILAVLAGCAEGGGGYGDPGASPLASGQSCGSIR